MKRFLLFSVLIAFLFGMLLQQAVAVSPVGKTATKWGEIKSSNASIASVKLAPPPFSCVRLDVYFIPQVPPGNWSNTKNCGQASVLNCVCYLRRVCMSYTAITGENKWLANAFNEPRYLDPNGYFTGGNKIGRLEMLARNYWCYRNSAATTNYSSNIDALYNELWNKHPVVVEVMTNMASSTANGDTYHFMVLVGMSIGTSDFNSYVWVNDVGKTNGKDRRYTLEQFKKSWATSNNHCVFIR